MLLIIIPRIQYLTSYTVYTLTKHTESLSIDKLRVYNILLKIHSL